MRHVLYALTLLPLAGALSAYSVEIAAPSIARSLANAAKVLTPATPEPAAVFVEADVPLEAPKQPSDEVSSPRPTSVRPRPPVARSAIPKKGVRIRAARVLQLANAGARPSGIFVPARGNRPPGLALAGVSGLGVGLIDGDVLTHAGGRPATSASAIVGMIIGARAKRVPELSGRFWRQGEAWNLIVEQPYVRKRRSGVAMLTASLAPSTGTGTSPSPSKARAYSARP